MKKEPKTAGAYEVGYGKPPQKHQFQPGNSGNPKGRSKGPGNLHKMIAKHASKKVTVIENGSEKKMAKMDVVVSAMFNSASKGDVGAARLLTSMLQAASELAGNTDAPEFTDADIAVMIDAGNWQAELVALKVEVSDGNE
ncbi:DUF5681 domain-containing protein [Falsihalocynthiibacter arcticus]|uniref:DUF5681 domain-containing protein n=1 Tax=Falsihalocynthiibacter arcticus TaxID=1579316 RepID=A0A126V1S0_9RHOB|nr:DUF5681 domain-containing protein [Falsihalocynthiibacter arcticus]AML51895.1 hypothetical protein RC74_12030 [Falsihalocynthiibacter arcticus]